jgi:putative oxidoreductase
MAQETPKVTSRKLDLAGWLLRGAVGFVFVSIGCEKLAAVPGSMWFKLFAQIGWGQWFRDFTGVIQILGGTLIVLPRTALVGMTMLACTMAGAILFHLFVLGDPFSSVIPAALLVAIVAIGRRKGSESDEITSLEL